MLHKMHISFFQIESGLGDLSSRPHSEFRQKKSGGGSLYFVFCGKTVE